MLLLLLLARRRSGLETVTFEMGEATGAHIMCGHFTSTSGFGRVDNHFCQFSLDCTLLYRHLTLCPTLALNGKSQTGRPPPPLEELASPEGLAWVLCWLESRPLGRGSTA